MIELTEDNFKEIVLNSNKKVLVDFNATWCPPCRMQESELDELSEDQDEVLIASCNIDSYPELAEKYEVASIPCMILFKDGAEVERKIGFTAKNKLIKMLEKY